MRPLTKTTKIQLLLVAAAMLSSPERSGISAFSPSIFQSKSSFQTTRPLAYSQVGKVKRRRSFHHNIGPLGMQKETTNSQTSSSDEHPAVGRNTEENRQHPLAHAAVAAALSLSILTTLLPLPANAGFGPTGGATTSQAPMQAIKDNAVESLSPAKLQQLIDSNMRGAGLSSLANQINNLVDALTLEEAEQEQEMKQLPKGEDESKYTSVSDFQAKERERLENAKILQQQIIKRTSMLEKLEAQPAWFNYFAAFIGSCISTSIMHPVDTIKTRLMMTSGVEEEFDLEEMINWNSSTSTENMTDVKATNYVAYEDEAETFLMTEENEEDSYEEEREMLTAVLTDTTTLEDETTRYDDSFSHSQNELSHQFSELQESNNREREQSQLMELRDTILNLYEGLLGNILKEGPPSALYLGVYEFVKLKLQVMSGITNAASSTVSVGPLLLTYLAAGAAGETVGSTIRAPAESLKSLVQTGVETSFPAAFQRVFGTPEGRANTFKAWSASVCRDVPFGATQLAIFELVKIYILNSSTIQWDAGTLQAEAIIGCFAGSIGSFITTPADVITTRIITQDPKEGEGFGIVGMAKKIYEEEGAQAFVSGWEQRVLYWGPAISIFLTCYCSVRQLGITYEWFG